MNREIRRIIIHVSCVLFNTKFRNFFGREIQGSWTGVPYSLIVHHNYLKVAAFCQV